VMSLLEPEHRALVEARETQKADTT